MIFLLTEALDRSSLSMMLLQFCLARNCLVTHI